jgi:hypothetical protein
MNYLISESSFSKLIFREQSSEKIKQFLINLGHEQGSKYTGSLEDYVKLAYDGDIIEFSKNERFKLVYLTNDNMGLRIHDLVMNTLNLTEPSYIYSKKEKVLGDFNVKSRGFNYKINSRAYKSGDYWRVLGISGDHGWGYSFIPKRNIMGVRIRSQVFSQVIDKYDLDKYMNL